MKDQQYLDILGKATEFTKKAGAYLGMSKKQIKTSSCNEVYSILKNKKTEIDNLILEFESLLEKPKSNLKLK